MPHKFRNLAGILSRFWSIYMLDNNTIIAVFDRHTQAETAIKQLQQSSFDMKNFSIVGKEYESDEQVVGYYNTGNRVKYWGKQGAFWGGIWGLLFGSAFFFIPGIGPLIVAGPLVSAIVGTLEGAVMGSGLSALGAGLYSLGIPKDSIIIYETALKAGKFVLMYHGTPEQLEMVKGVIGRNSEAKTYLHPTPVTLNV